MIEDIAASLPEGTTNSLTCPSCHGGHNADRSLSITKEDGLVKWICYRAKCGFRGIRGDNLNNVTTTTVNTYQAPVSYDRELFPLPDRMRDMLSARYYLSDDALDRFKWTGDALCFDIKNDMGVVTGQWLKGSDFKKRYAVADAMHWEWSSYTEHANADTCVLVEDPISALRVSQHCHAVALLGTNLSSEQANELADMFDRVVVMLDADAWDKATAMCMRYGILFDRMSYLTWVSERDPKDMQEDELIEVLSSLLEV